MKNHLIIIFCILFCSLASSPSSAAHRCNANQKSSLLRFKAESFENSSLQTWKPSTDCCSWSGVTCDNSTGHVIGLTLDGIQGRLLYSNSSLFNLITLQKLDLFYMSQSVQSEMGMSVTISDSPPPKFLIPSTLEKLSNLTHLTLADCGFSGQIPLQLSRLTRLVSLDLSSNDLRLENANDLMILIQNMTQLEELRLDGVQMSSVDWSTPLSNFVPCLHTLSLSGCSISGDVLLSFSNLRFISVIELHSNNLSTEVPEFFGNFSSLKSLELSFCDLRGEFPESILRLPYLENLGLSFNKNLQGSLLHLPKNIQVLSLSFTNFNGNIPESVGNLKNLTSLALDNCNFSGKIPNTIRKLSDLTFIDLSSNHFYGPVPSFENGFRKLLDLSMENNSFDGLIHLSLFTLPLLQSLNLGKNRFTNLPSEIPKNLSPFLIYLDLSDNSLQGSIPHIIFELTSLEELDLSSNNFSGILDMDSFANLKNLTILSLSENPFSIISRSHIPLPKLWKLGLRSCGLSQFPLFVQNLNELDNLDLSNNKISGHIPNWIWLSTLSYLNLSHNLLTDIDRPLPDVRLIYLDLSSNNLNGPIPLVSNYASFLDYSNNKFTSIIPTDISSYLINATFFSVSTNRLIGEIPESICSSEFLQVLDLSNNKLSGEIPTCLGKFSQDLSVLNLGGNGLWGKIPLTYSSNLRSIVFNGNMLSGTVPRSLSKCTLLEVLDIGNNQISDIFPFWLDNLPNLRVLILRSNCFSGHIEYARTNTPFPKIHVIDISFNGFTGFLPFEYFQKWKGMTEIQTGSTEVKYLGKGYYHDSVTVTVKGREMLLSRILTTFSTFDVSKNNLDGIIGDFGELKSLILLNLSHNGLVGRIPSSLENLSQLESLDLSGNKLSGEIPQALTSLTFLSVLDLSGNRLEGSIPEGGQFNTFSVSCYGGNEGLCGFPLDRKCRGDKTSGNDLLSDEENDESDSESMLNWKFVLMGYGSGLVAGLSTGYFFVSRNNGCFTNTGKRIRKSRFQRR